MSLYFSSSGSDYPVTLERKGEATVAGSSALKRKCPGGVASNLAVLGGNDPHSYGVTSRRASMNTLRPCSYSQAPRMPI